MVRILLLPQRIAFRILLLGSLLLAPVASAAQSPEFSKWNFDRLASRMESAQRERDQVSYVAALTTVARKFPSRLEELTPQSIHAAMRGEWTSPASPNAMGDMYESLFAANWKVNGRESATLQYWYIHLLIEQQRWSKADEVVRRIRSTDLALRLKSDRRADPLVQANPEIFDIDAMMVLQLKELEETAQQFPRRLSAWSSLFSAYREAGKFRQILAVTDELLAAAARAGSAERVFEDPEALNWVHDHRARAWQGLGDWAAAEREFRVAANLSEVGNANVSNGLNLANLLAEKGEAESALQVLSSLSKTKARLSAYGRMTEMRARHIAALSSRNPEAAATALEYFRNNRDAAPPIFLEALIREQKFDEAAAEFDRWLADPARRSDALDYVQDYAKVPHLLPAQQEYIPNFEAWLKREDVRASVDKVGRIEKVSMMSP
jgi:tetratricopeptide (TPR) repeat protein